MACTRKHFFLVHKARGWFVAQLGQGWILLLISAYLSDLLEQQEAYIHRCKWRATRLTQVQVHRVKRRKFDCFGPKSIFLTVLYHKTLEEKLSPKQFQCPLSLLRPRKFIYIIQITESLLKTLRVNYVLIREFKCTLTSEDQ